MTKLTDRRKFIKSASTSTSVGNSQNALRTMLERYGCSSYGVHEDYENAVTVVVFRVPDSDGEMVPVRLVVDADKVCHGLFGYGLDEASDYGRKQAERVAWRNLLLLVDASLAAAALNLRSLRDTFLADLVVTDAKGRPMRFIDELEASTGGAWRDQLQIGSGEA